MAARMAIAAALALCAAAASQQEVVETWPDGSVRERFAVDADGRRDGAYERFREDGSVELRGLYLRGERSGTWTGFAPDGRRTVVETFRHDQLDGRRETFHPDGALAQRAVWRRGLLDGAFEEHAADGVRSRTGRYADGELHGTVQVSAGRRTLSRQTWVRGELARLDDIDRPFPVARHALLETLAAILAEPDPPVAADGDPKAPRRAAALRRLMAYRHLCRLAYAELELVPEWNDLCDAAAEVCAANGGLSHDPPRPPGMDEERYRQGHLGASRSNLSGGGMVGSVDAYMDDSDPSNIDRIGHRRWCLNPAMRKTGFGEHEGYSAMWSMDGSGSAPKGMEAVLYPPPGWVPVDMFGPRRAWSVALLRGGSPRADQLAARVRRLDEDWVPTGEPLALDWLNVAGGGYGGAPCAVFRPVGIEVRPGIRYLAELSVDGGRTFAWRYVVAFCEPVGAPR
jgi:hypothetical protein